MIDFQ